MLTNFQGMRRWVRVGLVAGVLAVGTGWAMTAPALADSATSSIAASPKELVKRLGDAIDGGHPDAFQESTLQVAPLWRRDDLRSAFGHRRGWRAGHCGWRASHPSG